MPELRIRGLQQCNRALARIAREYPEAALQALTEEAEIEMTEAKARTPVDTGALRASGHVVVDRDRGTVTMRFGNSAVDYALKVHEDLEAFHKVGQAKYLESVVLEAIPHLPARVAARVAEIMGAR